MEPRSLALILVLALFFPSLLSADPTPPPPSPPLSPDSPSTPPPPDSPSTPPPPASPPPPPPSASPPPPPPPPPPPASPPPPPPSPATPPPPPPSPATPPPPPPPLSTVSRRPDSRNSGVRRPPLWNASSPGHRPPSSSCPSDRHDCQQHVRREGLNFGQKLGLFFIGVFLALQVVFGTFLVYKRVQLKKVERREQREMASFSESST